MSTRETSPEIASMAGRILAAGNPLDNDQVILAVIEGLADANTGKQAQAALKTMFQPYFENMLSLAGSCLAQAEDDDSDGLPRIAITATVDWSKITNAPSSARSRAARRTGCESTTTRTGPKGSRAIRSTPRTRSGPRAAR